MDEFKHKHQRKFVADYFAKNQQEDISHDQLFVAAKDFAQSRSKCCDTDEAKIKFENCYGNSVFLIGQAGIGKSTFCKNLVRKMLDANNPPFGEKIVFYFKLRDINYEKNINLLQFFTSGNRILQNYTDGEQKKIINWVESLKEKVFIVMDGLDEASIKTIEQNECELDEKVKAEVLVANLIRGKLLPQSQKNHYITATSTHSSS